MAMKNVEIEVFSLSDLEDTQESNYGLAGSPTQVERIFPPEKNTSRQLYEDSGEKLGDVVYDILKQKKIVD